VQSREVAKVGAKKFSFFWFELRRFASSRLIRAPIQT
jgi:hypothetical protein